MNYPNLVIAGAPKCGTTSLFDWLNAHPQVCGSSVKETYYFVDEGSPFLKLPSGQDIDNYHQYGADHYGQYFSHASAQEKIYCEATPHYMYQNTAMEYFSGLKPQPHVIFMLRKPSARIYSSFNFSQKKLSALDKSITFSHFVDALLCDDIGKIDKYVKHERAKYRLGHGLSFSRYHEYILRWLKNYSPSRLRIVVFEDIVKNPVKFLREICEDVNIDPDFYTGFDPAVSNASFYVRNKLIHYWIVRRKIPFLNDFEHRLPEPITNFFQSLYKELNTRKIEISQSDLDALSRLDDYFSVHNQMLSRDFGLDLASWEY